MIKEEWLECLEQMTKSKHGKQELQIPIVMVRLELLYFRLKIWNPIMVQLYMKKFSICLVTEAILTYIQVLEGKMIPMLY